MRLCLSGDYRLVATQTVSKEPHSSETIVACWDRDSQRHYAVWDGQWRAAWLSIYQSTMSYTLEQAVAFTPVFGTAFMRREDGRIELLQSWRSCLN